MLIKARVTAGYLFSFPFLDQRDEPFRSHPLYGPPALDKTPAEPIGETAYPPGGLAPHNLDGALPHASIAKMATAD